MVGRAAEIKKLETAYRSNRAEFVGIYGRRRVGKTFLVNLCVLAICRSPLCKTAIFGQDANCGRFITALGYSGADIDPDKISMFLSGLPVYEKGVALPFDEEVAKEKLSEHDILIRVELNDGEYNDRMWTCDFTYDYVKINASYRS